MAEQNPGKMIQMPNIHAPPLPLPAVFGTALHSFGTDSLILDVLAEHQDKTDTVQHLISSQTQNKTSFSST